MSVVVLAGGVGGAKLASGLAAHVGSELTVVANTGDDFQHLGLHISPDLDTLMYTLAGIANPVTGWGIVDETWSFLSQVEKFGGPVWFRLGDKDLGTHVLRTQLLRTGHRLTTITNDLARQLGVECRLLPMCDERVATIIHSDGEALPFQDYFVRLQCRVPVRAISFDGIEAAQPTPELQRALAAPTLSAIFLAPSNPFVSIDPILAVPGLRHLISGAGVPVVAVSPIIAGAAVKGPAAKIMSELGLDISASTVAAHYKGLITGFVVDQADAALVPGIEQTGIVVCCTETMMRDAADRNRLAGTCLSFAQGLARP
jgi:LPPG:FO 2-phospho-L-lactate transferase